MDNLQTLRDLVIKFCYERGWKQFHNPKGLALSLSSEVSELLEHFQWKTKMSYEIMTQNI
jgi:hypothetical protein